MVALKVEDLAVRYGTFEAVSGVSFEVLKGEMFGIVGGSGSGKTTIAKVLCGLKGKSSGSVAFADGVKPQMIFQDASGSLNPRMKVEDTLCEVLKLRSPGGNLRERALELLSLTGLPDIVMQQYPHEMSGGQCQRVSIARALACGDEFLVADEPVSALDVSVQARILNLLRRLNRENSLTVVVIVHDLAVVKNICDRVMVLENGRIADIGVTEDVFADPKSDYTKALLAAVPGRVHLGTAVDIEI